MTKEQKEAILALKKALERAYRCDGLDVLQDEMQYPDSINDVCDTVTAMCITISTGAALKRTNCGAWVLR